MSPEICRAARQLLGWTEEQLAAAALCSSQTIRNFEARRHRATQGTRSAIRTALDQAGVEFLPGNGAGVQMKIREERNLSRGW